MAKTIPIDNPAITDQNRSGQLMRWIFEARDILHYIADHTIAETLQDRIMQTACRGLLTEMDTMNRESPEAVLAQMGMKIIQTDGDDFSYSEAVK
jgi:hypothetical protein